MWLATTTNDHTRCRGTNDFAEVGANCHAVDSGGCTPLRWAASNGHEAAMRALECSGADIDAAQQQGV